MYVAVADEASRLISSDQDADFNCVQKRSEEYSQLHSAINNARTSSLLQDVTSTINNIAVPAVVTPTNANDGILLHREYFYNFEGTVDAQLAITNLYKLMRDCEKNNKEIPAQLHSLVHHALKMCTDSSTEHLHKVKHCSENGKIRFDQQQLYYSMPKTRSLKKDSSGKVPNKAVLNRTNSIIKMLEVFMERESNDQVKARVIRCLMDKLSELYPQHDCIEDERADNEVEIQSDYWESRGAKKLFGYSSSYIPTEEEDDDDYHQDIESIVMKRIERLKRVYTTPNGYQSVLSDKEKEMSVSDYNRYRIGLKSRYIAAALKHSLGIGRSDA